MQKYALPVLKIRVPCSKRKCSFKTVDRQVVNTTTKIVRRLTNYSSGFNAFRKHLSLFSAIAIISLTYFELSEKAGKRNTAGESLPPRPLRDISRCARNDGRRPPQAGN